MLMYPAGAQNVRCARCTTITSVAAAPPQAESMAQLCCSNAQCRVVLLYPRGAGQVQVGAAQQAAGVGRGMWAVNNPGEQPQGGKQAQHEAVLLTAA